MKLIFSFETKSRPRRILILIGPFQQAGSFEFDAIVGVDIVFQIDEQANLTGGFQVIFPNPASITADLRISDFGKLDFTVNHNLYVFLLPSSPLFLAHPFCLLFVLVFPKKGVDVING